MKKSLNILAVIFLIVLLVGLVGCGRTSQRQEEGDVNFRTGTRALEMRIIEDDPSWTVYEHDIFSIGVELFNKGAYPIEGGGYSQLFLTGYDPDIIKNIVPGSLFPPGNLPQYGTFAPIPPIEPRTQFNEEGGYQVMQFYSGEIILPPGTTNYDVPLYIYACYPYETLASGDVCIDPQPHRTNVDKPCWTHDVSMGAGQGAPVSINYIGVTNMKDSLRLSFSISNSGNGDVVDETAIWDGKCPTSFTPMDINIIDLIKVTVGNYDVTVDCEPKDRIRIVNGNGKIVCNIRMAAMPAYQSMYNEGTAFVTPVEIQLRYGYRTYIQKHIQIRGYD